MTGTDHDFETGSSVLVDTSAADCERTNGYSPLHDETDALVAVTYDRSADSFLRTWRRRTGTVPEFVRIIEVGRTMRSTADDSMADTPPDERSAGVVETVDRPNDLDGVREAIASALAASDGETVLVFDSLTTPTEHVSIHEMIPFFHAVSNLLTDADAVGYFYCSEPSDISAVAPFRALVDETVELDDTNDGALPRPAPRDGPPLDTLFEALSSRRRRDALRYLLDTEDAVDISELATALARLGPGGGSTHNQHRKYYSTLYQLHLPKLDSAGLIDYDERNHRVSVRDGARWAESFLALVEE
ncbi:MULTISPECIES: hypothetical protein [unclassified Haladaptatus]|uniref:DUF7504 family protein n=1 Tax=unclassified Haladaptatus TaxID=2622732 RepID=UPI00209C0AFA|nr:MULTISPECIES: hypothetical protein [unclassified Haladaptatus]MCO8243820.1 hypothetical protein [Haladaptatus sp. AB643]MCO8253433.1 hypothetical protein [Haladaptatus sp. AB618]